MQLDRPFGLSFDTLEQAIALPSLPVIVQLTVPVMWILGAISDGETAARNVTGDPVNGVVTDLDEVIVTAVACSTLPCAANAGVATPITTAMMPTQPAHLRFFTTTLPSQRARAPARSQCCSSGRILSITGHAWRCLRFSA
jgi:hypothetical protein